MQLYGDVKVSYLSDVFYILDVNTVEALFINHYLISESEKTTSSWCVHHHEHTESNPNWTV